jgi:nucleoid DNA-binding protein
MALEIAEETKLKQVDVKKVVQKVLNYIIDSLAKGEAVELRNFGVFKVRTRRPRMGRNPKTGEAVAIPERKRVIFKAGLVMKKKVK